MEPKQQSDIWIVQRTPMIFADRDDPVVCRWLHLLECLVPFERVHDNLGKESYIYYCIQKYLVQPLQVDGLVLADNVLDDSANELICRVLADDLDFQDGLDDGPSIILILCAAVIIRATANVTGTVFQRFRHVFYYMKKHIGP